MMNDFVPITDLIGMAAPVASHVPAPGLNLKTAKIPGFMFPRLDERKVAFITQPSMFRAYTGTRINAATQVYPIQAFLWLSAYLKQQLPAFRRTVFDMGILDPQGAHCWKELVHFLLAEKPKYICMTVTTPIYYEAKLIGIVAKQLLGPEVVVVHGGKHVSALYRESLTDSMCDVVVIEEGEIALAELCQGKPWADIDGIAYRADDQRWMTITALEIISRLEKFTDLRKPSNYSALQDEIYALQQEAVVSIDPYVKTTLPRPLMTSEQLDALPFQDLGLYDIWRYHNPKLVVKKHPGLQLETSRGCPYACDFCSAEDEYRVLSPDRVIEEMRYYKRYGIETIRISDDQFLTDVRRGEIIAEKMLQAGLHFHINLGNGVRADRCTVKFLELFKRAGLYETGAGFESGDQATLDSMRKSLNMEKSLQIMEVFRKVGVAVVGFFIFGAEKETLQSMQRTIDFAKALNPSFAKVTIYTPFPDTQAYARWKRRGLIVSERWDHYNIHKAAGVYRHPNPELTPEVLTEWYRKFYRDFYRRPGYLLHQAVKSVLDRSILWKIPTAFQTFFPSVFRTSPLDNVKARYFDGRRPKPVAG